MPANDLKLVTADVEGLLLQPVNDPTPEKIVKFDSKQESSIDSVDDKTPEEEESVLKDGDSGKDAKMEPAE